MRELKSETEKPRELEQPSPCARWPLPTLRLLRLGGFVAEAADIVLHVGNCSLFGVLLRLVFELL